MWVVLIASFMLGGVCLAVAISVRDARWAHQKAARTSCPAALKVLWLEILLQADQTNFSVTQAIAQILTSPQGKFLQCAATSRPYEINAASEKWLNEEKFGGELAIWCRDSHAEGKYDAMKFRGHRVSLTERQLPSAKGLTE